MRIVYPCVIPRFRIRLWFGKRKKSLARPARSLVNAATTVLALDPPI